MTAALSILFALVAIGSAGSVFVATRAKIVFVLLRILLAAAIVSTAGALLAVIASVAGAATTSRALLLICLNLLAIVIPILWLHLRLAENHGRWFALLAIVPILWWMTEQENLSGVAFAIGWDGLALGLTIAAVALLVNPRVRFQRILAVLLLAAGLIWASIIIPALDAKHSPLMQHGIASLGAALLDLIHSTRIPLGFLLAIFVLGQIAVPSGKHFADAWIILCAAAIFTVPGAAFESIKTAESPASFGIFGFLIALAAMTLLIRLFRRARESANQSGENLLIASLCILLIWESIGTLFTADGVPALIDVIRHSIGR